MANFHGHDDNVTNLFFVRHAESFNNCLYEEVWKIHGKDISDEFLLQEEAKLRQADCTLSERGHRQAEKLRQFASHGGIHCISSLIKENSDKFEIFTSPMKRCLLTCNQLSQGIPNAPVHVVPNLFESHGCYDHLPSGETRGLPGYSSREIAELFPNFICPSDMENGWYHLPHKEKEEEFVERAKAVLKWVWSLHENDRHEGSKTRNVIIVAHGNLICVLLNLLLNSRSALFVMNNTGVSQLQLNTLGGKRKLASLKYHNRVDHLLPDTELLTGSDVYDDHWVQEYTNYDPFI